MLKMNVGLKSVLFFVSFLFLLSTSKAESRFSDVSNTKHVVKIISQDLWSNGVFQKEKVENLDTKDSKKVIYFPEELEIALRLINS